MIEEDVLLVICLLICVSVWVITIWLFLNGGDDDNF